MQLRFERSDEIRRETLTLPAATYNRLTVLFARGAREPLFVPIRNMQYLAIVDREEVIFVDGARRRFIQVAWQDFHRQQRASLQDPVEYQQIYYEPAGIAIAPRLPGEFLRALVEMESKQAENTASDASVTPLKR